MQKLTRQSGPGPARRRRAEEDTGGLFKRVVAKLTRRASPPPAPAHDHPSDWEPLSWLRSWECEALPQFENMVNEPARPFNHIHESIFLASTLTGFML
jgi:hypothetical protein